MAAARTSKHPHAADVDAICDVFGLGGLAKLQTGQRRSHRDIDVSDTAGVLRKPEAACDQEMADENSRLSEEDGCR
jgi:hypothetical protein